MPSQAGPGLLDQPAVLWLLIEHIVTSGEVQVPAVVKLTTWPFNSSSGVIFVLSVVNVGAMCSPAPST